MSQFDPPPPRFYPAPPPELKPIAPWIWIASIVGVLALCAAAIPLYKSYNSIKAQTQQANDLLAGLHAKMIQADDAGIFAASDPLYQQEVGEAKSDALFDNIRQQLGAPRSSIYVGEKTLTDPKYGSVLSLTFSTRFDLGTGREIFTLRKSDSGYRMLRYVVRSKELKNQFVTKPVGIRP
jgi:hypothetical protein